MRKSDYQHRLDFWRKKDNGFWTKAEAELMASGEKLLADEAYYLMRQRLSETWAALKAAMPAWIRRRLG